MLNIDLHGLNQQSLFECFKHFSQFLLCRGYVFNVEKSFSTLKADISRYIPVSLTLNSGSSTRSAVGFFDSMMIGYLLKPLTKTTIFNFYVMPIF